jgi:IclR family pca regulon transcriptional regulator
LAVQPRDKGKPKVREDRSFISSLAHGLAVLEAVAESENDIPLTSLAKRVNLKKTNTWRLTHTLLRLGYLRQDPDTRRFSPSPRVLALGFAYFDRLDLRQIALPFLNDLSNRVREMVNLAILDGDELVFAERIKTSQVVNINLHPGSRLPLYNTAMGRALIFDMPQVWLRQYMARLRDDPRAAKYTQDGGRKLLKMLKDIQERGYAISDNERIDGVRSAACPIRDKSSQTVAAINVLVPSTRVSLIELRERLVPEVVETAARISTALGFRGKSAGQGGSTYRIARTGT